MNSISPLIEENNSAFAIRVEHRYFQTRKREEATETYYISKDAEEPARIIKEMKNPNDTHKYTAKNSIAEINKRLQRNGVCMLYRGNEAQMNMHHFNNFTSYFGMKENERFCFVNRIDKIPRYYYSIQAIDFIVDEIKKAPDRILNDLKQRCSKKKC